MPSRWRGLGSAVVLCAVAIGTAGVARAGSVAQIIQIMSQDPRSLQGSMGFYVSLMKADNGLPAAHWTTEEYEKGFFSLQIHSGKQGTVHFRNIKVKEL